MSTFHNSQNDDIKETKETQETKVRRSSESKVHSTIICATCPEDDRKSIDSDDPDFEIIQESVDHGDPYICEQVSLRWKIVCFWLTCSDVSVTKKGEACRYSRRLRTSIL